MRGPEPGARAGLALLLLLAWLPSPAGADPPAPKPPDRYATLPFAFSPPEHELHWLAEAFALSIADRLETLGYTVASRRERVDAAAPAGVASASPVTLASRIKLARALGASRAVTGTLALETDGGPGAAARLTARWAIIDVERGIFISERAAKGTLDEIFPMIDAIALETAHRDPGPPGPDAHRILESLDDPPFPALATVMRAVVEQDPDRQTAALAAAQDAARPHPMLRRRVADALVEAGRADEGLLMLQSLDARRQPDAWRLHLDCAEILMARGDVDAAAVAAGRSVGARDTAPAHILLSRIALARDDVALAALEARLAAAIDPGHAALPSLLDQLARRSVSRAPLSVSPP